MTTRIARAPGRVNLIGDHTDYTGGLVFPMAVDRWTEIRFEPADRVELTSADEAEPVSLPLHVADPTAVNPHWGRYVAGVVSELQPTTGIHGHVTTTIPIGGGMSSSHALEVAVALALGFEGSVVELAQLTQRAENRASGVPTRRSRLEVRGSRPDESCRRSLDERRRRRVDCPRPSALRSDRLRPSLRPAPRVPRGFATWVAPPA